MLFLLFYNYCIALNRIVSFSIWGSLANFYGFSSRMANDSEAISFYFLFSVCFFIFLIFDFAIIFIINFDRIMYWLMKTCWKIKRFKCWSANIIPIEKKTIYLCKFVHWVKTECTQNTFCTYGTNRRPNEKWKRKIHKVAQKYSPTIAGI